ncbi:hypothetical protein [Goekera deserti]|uniref:Uncharacterized protein n=2 Tax=Goekera deserti TaxID=2497753 RepID=A0A7K3WJG5_9ACTN|nr:hypothetical protein [Goekera deserti]NEL56648.1 hypothetical protein [Goekera deserti]
MAAVAVSTAGCSEQTPDHNDAAYIPASQSEIPSLDGTQSYAVPAGINAVNGDLAQRGVQCPSFDEQDAPPALEQALCTTQDGRTAMISIWPSAEVRDDEVAARLDDPDPCLVSGRDAAAWSVDASASPELCRQVAMALGGVLVQAPAP